MKSRLTLIFAALVVLLGAMVWVVQDRNATSLASALAAVTPSVPSPVIAPLPEAPPVPAAMATAIAATLATVERQADQPVQEAAAPMASPVASVPEGKSPPVVRVSKSGVVTYVAREGDTLSQLAIALLGSDSQERRDAVIAANPSLKQNTDLVLTGQTYSIALPLVRDEPKAAVEQGTPVVSAKPVAEEKNKPNAKAGEKTAAVAEGPNLRYSAQPGDTVRVLATNLLGGDTQFNRDAIIAENKSLQHNPDHMVAGQSYTIPGSNGLAANPKPLQVKVPTTRPDADDILRDGAGRTLRYTAQPGDSVSKLAIVLMGSDTQANRDLIIQNNPSLKMDADHLTAGQTYWISAPVAGSE